MTRAYDPVKAHEYYEANKKLKGRPKAASRPIGGVGKKAVSKAAGKSVKAQKTKERIGRLRSKIKKLKSALSETEALLSEKRQSARKSEKENSDGKTSAKERQSSKEYREKNQQKIASKQKSESSGGSSSSSKSVSDMNVEELTERSNKIRATLKDAQRQLSNANQELGQLAHSSILSHDDVNELFTQFHSAERIPSK